MRACLEQGACAGYYKYKNVRAIARLELATPADCTQMFE